MADDAKKKLCAVCHALLAVRSASEIQKLQRSHALLLLFKMD